MHATRVSRRQLLADCTFTREKVVHATSRRHGSLSDPLSWKKGCKHLCESMKCFGFSESLSPHTQHLDVKLSPRRCKGGLVQSPVFMLRLWEKMAPVFKKHAFFSSFCPSSAALSPLLQPLVLLKVSSCSKQNGFKLKQVLVSQLIYEARHEETRPRPDRSGPDPSR